MTGMAGDSTIDLRPAFENVLGDRDLRGYFLAYGSLFFVSEVFTQALPLYFRELGVSLAILGLITSASNAFELAAEPVSGILSDRIDRALLAAAAAVAMAALFGMLAFATAVLALAALIVGVSLAKLVFRNAVTPAIADALEDGVEGLGWGLRDVAIYAGSALGLAVGGAVATATGTVGVVFLPLVVVMAGTATLLWGRRDGGGDDEERIRQPSTADVRRALFDVAPIEAFREISDWNVLARFCVIEAFATLGSGMTLFLLPAFAADVGVPVGGVLFVFSASHLLSAPMSLLGGGLADRYSRKWLYVGSYAASTAMLLSFGVARDVWLFGVGMAIFVGKSAFAPAVTSYFFDQFDEGESGRAWSVEGMVSRGAGIVAPAVGGFLYGIDPRWTFLVGGLLMGVGAAVSVTLPE